MPQAITEEMAEKLSQYERQWVALSLDKTRVIGHDKSLVALGKRIDEQHQEVIYMKVPPTDAFLSYQF
jgi:hypothetical protein